MVPGLVQDSPESGNSPDLKIAKPAAADVDLFHRLVGDLNRILGPSSGLNSEDVDVDHLAKLMKDYVSQEKDWKKYAFSDLSRGYTRNLVDEGNGKSNLVSLCDT